MNNEAIEKLQLRIKRKESDILFLEVEIGELQRAVQKMRNSTVD
jgi:SMC interacting uncharacterized protein involved in chromosome segregation